MESVGEGRYRELEPERRRVTGYRYYTKVGFHLDGARWGSALLLGDEPYTAEVVAAELSARGYDVLSVDVGRLGWVVTTPGYSFHERYRLVVHPRDWSHWDTLQGEGVTWLVRRRCWAVVWGRESDDDVDCFLPVSREQARRLAGVFHTGLPEAAVLREIHEHAHARLRRSWDRAAADRQRAARLRGRGVQLDRWAAELTATPPLREAVPAGFGPDPARVAATAPVPVQLDEPFALLRQLYGHFGGGTTFLANRLRVATPAGEARVTLTVWLSPRTLEYQAVTPFCPEEGYSVDEADSDPGKRAAKLQETYLGRVDNAEAAFPISPQRLWILVDHAAKGDDLWLQLSFPDGSTYLSAPSPDPHGHHDAVYEEFVPVGIPLAFVPGIAPEWVSINVPRSPELLKTVTARLRYLPERPKPSRSGYFEW